MDDFYIFNNELEEYLKQHESSKNGDVVNLFEKFYSKIKDLECQDFRLYYFKAYYQNTSGDLANAKINIDKSIYYISHIEDLPFIKIFIFANNYAPIHSQFADVYFIAGEIYAKLNKNSESIKYYQCYQYYQTFIKSEFSEAKELTVFSFRKFNEYTLSDLINRTITVCPSNRMNDPFDSIINLWSNENRLEKCCTEKNHIKPLTESYKFYRIRSFCMGKNVLPIKNVLMWSHYADEHYGFCIKYKLSEEFINQPENGNYEHKFLKKIIYSNKAIDITSNSINSNTAFFTKNKFWKYENEVRLLVYNPNRSDDFYGIPLDKKSQIHSIYFGYRCPSSTINTIKNIFSNSDTIPKFYKMDLNEKDIYALIPKEI